MKYYTPILEEFYVDFPFEFIWSPSNEWEKATFGEEIYWTIDTIKEELDSKKIRVKYLDEQDIKELGWELTSTNGMVVWFHGKEEWFGKEIPGSPLYKYWNYTLTFDSKYSSIKIECRTSNGDTDTFFEGIIKNKSELKKLMNQLGI